MSMNQQWMAIDCTSCRGLGEACCKLSMCMCVCSTVVRGSALAVMMGLVRSPTAHTTPRLASTLPSDMPFSGGSYRSREVPEVVSR